METSRLTRDGTAETVSRDQILRHERGQGNIHFPCSADHVQDWQPYPVGPYSCYMCDHTYIHTLDQCSITLAPTATAAAISSLGMFSPYIPSTRRRWAVLYRSDAIVVLVRGCYGGHGSCCNLVLLGHISSSKTCFVQCFERREQFRRSVLFLCPPAE